MLLNRDAWINPSPCVLGAFGFTCAMTALAVGQTGIKRCIHTAVGIEEDCCGTNEGVDADGGDVVQSLDSGLDLVLGGTHVADEHKSLQQEGMRRRWSGRAGTGRGSSH